MEVKLIDEMPYYIIVLPLNNNLVSFVQDWSMFLQTFTLVHGS